MVSYNRIPSDTCNNEFTINKTQQYSTKKQPTVTNKQFTGAAHPGVPTFAGKKARPFSSYGSIKQASSYFHFFFLKKKEKQVRFLLLKRIDFFFQKSIENLFFLYIFFKKKKITKSPNLMFIVPSINFCTNTLSSLTSR